MKSFLLYLWQLPQNLIGLFLLLVNLHSYSKNNDNVYIVKHLSNSGISLGNYILIDSDMVYNYKVVNHERGHQKQSLYLGWLYLIVIGLPSLLGNIFFRGMKSIKGSKWVLENYYKTPWESWADKLGGVKR